MQVIYYHILVLVFLVHDRYISRLGQGKKGQTRPVISGYLNITVFRNVAINKIT